MRKPQAWEGDDVKVLPFVGTGSRTLFPSAEVLEVIENGANLSDLPCRFGGDACEHHHRMEGRIRHGASAIFIAAHLGAGLAHAERNRPGEVGTSV